MTVYVLRDEGVSDPFQAESHEAALALARERLGEWDEPELRRTVWVRQSLVAIHEDGTEEDLGPVVARIDPPLASECPRGGEHTWDPARAQVWGGPGAGVTIVERCGCGVEVLRMTECACEAQVVAGSRHECIEVRQLGHA